MVTNEVPLQYAGRDMRARSHRGIAVLAASILLHKIDSPFFEFHNRAVEVIAYTNMADYSETMFMFPFFFIVAFFSASLPDWDMKFRVFYPKEVRHEYWRYHRQITHSLLLFIAALVFGFAVVSDLDRVIFVGYMGIMTGVGSHLVADMLTGTIPLGLGGRVRIGIRLDWFRKKLPVISDNVCWIYYVAAFLILYISFF